MTTITGCSLAQSAAGDRVDLVFFSCPAVVAAGRRRVALLGMEIEGTQGDAGSCLAATRQGRERAQRAKWVIGVTDASSSRIDDGSRGPCQFGNRRPRPRDGRMIHKTHKRNAGTVNEPTLRAELERPREDPTMGGAGVAEAAVSYSSPASFCALGHPAGRRFRFSAGSVPVEKCLRHAASHRPLLRNAVATALVVGTALTLINQGNVVLNGRFPAELWWKIPLTYSVPYLVSTWAALRISLVRPETLGMP